MLWTLGKPNKYCQCQEFVKLVALIVLVSYFKTAKHLKGSKCSDYTLKARWNKSSDIISCDIKVLDKITWTGIILEVNIISLSYGENNFFFL